MVCLFSQTENVKLIFMNGFFMFAVVNVDGQDSLRIEVGSSAGTTVA